MTGQLLFILLLIFTVESSEQDKYKFFISAPNVFHLGVNEKVVVQMGEPHLNNDVTLYLEDQTTNTLLSEKKIFKAFTDESQIKLEELMINWTIWSDLPKKSNPPYAMLVAESPSFSSRYQTRVLVSKHRGYIFIQTHQPMYNPEKQDDHLVSYRVFTLDHTMRPHEETFFLSVFNPDGNRVLKIMKSARGGIFRGSFPLPSVSKTGTWKITAHYEDDEDNAASREFEVQKFVLPTFEVNIEMEQKYILVDGELPDFTILAKYSYGEKVQGAYHCKVGVATKSKPDFIKGMDAVGSIRDGTATVSLQSLLRDMKLKNQTMESLSELMKKGQKLYVGVSVTNTQNGEMQEAEVYLPILSHQYTMDLSRTRSHFVPGEKLDVVVSLRHPDGSPAVGVRVRISLQGSTRQDSEVLTDNEGAVSPSFVLATNEVEITVDVSASGLQKTKRIRRASSPSNSYLYITYNNKIHSVKDNLILKYKVLNGPIEGYIYFMVLSRGTIIQNGSFQIKKEVEQFLKITPNMVPSFRVIAYYHNQHGDIIADSVWVDVRDECEIKVEVKHNGNYEPGKQAVLQINLHKQQAKVALLAVDKAFYGLNVENKLTSKQVFSSMKSYDLGCTYSGGSDSASALVDAGLSFVSHGKEAWRKRFGCKVNYLRNRRSVNLEQEMTTLKSRFNNTSLQDCCVQGFSDIPMKRTCQERKARVLLVKGNPCADIFLHCCLEGERLRNKKMKEDLDSELGRTTAMEEIELFFLDSSRQRIRQYFPSSFEFKEFDVDHKKTHSLRLPDSITTWEIQVVTLSPVTGFCVAKPTEVKAFKESFVSLRLPYSVKKYEQLSIRPVIYNYGEDKLEVAVHMGQTEGLCSPASATSTSFVNITVEPQSAQFVSFSAVPMVTGEVPIKISLYHMRQERGVDAIQKNLIVKTEGMIQTQEETRRLKLDGRSTMTIDIDGTLPNGVVPNSISNIFISIEGEGFGDSHAKNLLSPKKVAAMIRLPSGCAEQTMTRLVPTALAIRYLDHSDQWFDLPAGKRDEALDHLEEGTLHIIGHYEQNDNGAYKVFSGVPYSNWITAYIVKVLSMVAERQMMAIGPQGRKARYIPLDGIRKPVHYLLSVQKPNGSFGDPNPVLHRQVLKDRDQDAAMTSFITVALQKSLEFLESEKRTEAEARISRSTSYLRSQVDELQHPFAVAITAYCLSLCTPKGTNHVAIWTKLKSMAIKAKNGCYLWTTLNSTKNMEKADAISVEATAYALLTAVRLEDKEWADQTACWLTTQQSFYGGYRSTQDTVMALEALAEYELKRPKSPEAKVRAEFTAQGRKELITLQLEDKRERVETDLKKLTGNHIVGTLTGTGIAQMKIMKSYYVLDAKDDCAQLSINITVEGKVKYTAQIVQNYDYYDYDYSLDKETQLEKPGTATEPVDAQTRKRRDLENSPNSDVVTYKVRVRNSLSSSLSGMAIADITLLSGFEAEIEDLERLKLPSEQYITHYEVSNGRVLLYFNELYNSEGYIEFDAVQREPVGLLQPATAVFYDYYEPNRKCTVFYSAPQRSKLVSKLCSGDVCQCAERPCHKLQETFKLRRNGRITEYDRINHACFSPTADYVYMVNILSVSVKSNFELYTARVTNVLKSSEDLLVSEDSDRVFAIRHHCKEELELGQSYLIMGKDGQTPDSNGHMQYLLESNTWVEKEPSVDECTKTGHNETCQLFIKFLDKYKTGGCDQ